MYFPSTSSIPGCRNLIIVSPKLRYATPTNRASVIISGLCMEHITRRLTRKEQLKVGPNK